MVVTKKVRRLLIIEEIPKSEKKNESLILEELSSMIMHNKSNIDIEIVTIDRGGKRYLDKFFKKEDNYRPYHYIHLSGHGAEDDHGNFYFSTHDKGYVSPFDFPKGGFKGKTITLSSCELGKKKFIKDFMEHTCADSVVAPVLEIEFEDAALWFAYYYYLVLKKELPVTRAYNAAKNYLKVNSGRMDFFS